MSSALGVAKACSASPLPREISSSDWESFDASLTFKIIRERGSMVDCGVHVEAS